MRSAEQLSSHRPKRLFFCVTPLNLLVAQAIRARAPGWDTLVYAPSLRTAKYQFYYDRFEWDCKVCPVAGPGPLPDLAYQVLKTVKAMNALKNLHYDQLFFANIGSLTFSSIAARYVDASIATFDDGTLHADEATFTKWLRQEPFSHRLYRRLAGAASNASVLSRVERHYTIFPAELCQLKVPEVVEVPLFADLEARFSHASGRVKVLLGTPENKLVLGIDDGSYERLVSTLDPDIYLPHPRERRKALIRLPQADADRLAKAAEVFAAEDFILELVKFGYDPVIEGFGSTAILNLSRHFATRTYFPAGRPPQPIFAKLGVASQPIEPILHNGRNSIECD